MEDVVETLGVVENTIGTITSLPIWNNRTYRKFAWGLKIIAQFVEIVIGGIVLGTDIVPNMKNNFYLENPEGYKIAAVAYIVFFALEITLDMTLWTFLRCTGKHDACVIVSVVLSVFFEMPIMICGLYLMRYKGTIDWDQQFFELMLQIWYIVNLMLQITFGVADKVYDWTKCWGVIFVAPLSYVIACLPYAFVIIPMSGWHWFEKLDGYYNNRQNFIHGTFNSTDSNNMLDFLIVSGFVGQWIWNIIFNIIVFAVVLKCYSLVVCKERSGRVAPG